MRGGEQRDHAPAARTNKGWFMALSFGKRAAIVLVAVALAAACTPVVRRHGYVPETESLKEIEPARDTRSTVLARFGNPSTRGAFGDDTWYYITSVRQQLGYLRPESSARAITAVRFAPSGVVASVDRYSLEDGRVVSLVNRKTPTRGRELTLIEQLLGNVGALPADTLLGQENLPGGAGGPRRNE